MRRVTTIFFLLILGQCAIKCAVSEDNEPGDPFPQAEDAGYCNLQYNNFDTFLTDATFTADELNDALRDNGGQIVEFVSAGPETPEFFVDAGSNFVCPVLLGVCIAAFSLCFREKVGLFEEEGVDYAVIRVQSFGANGVRATYSDNTDADPPIILPMNGTETLVFSKDGAKLEQLDFGGTGSVRVDYVKTGTLCPPSQSPSAIPSQSPSAIPSQSPSLKPSSKSMSMKSSMLKSKMSKSKMSRSKMSKSKMSRRSKGTNAPSVSAAPTVTAEPTKAGSKMSGKGSSSSMSSKMLR